MSPDSVLETGGVDARAARDFGREARVFRHHLHHRPMFDDDALASLLDRYPRERLGVFTMNGDPTDWRSWRRGQAGALSGKALLDIVRRGRIWLNLRAANEALPEYDALSREMFGALEAQIPGLKTFKRDVGVLISSPHAQVFYHLDVARVTLWHLRGEKRAWIYPPAAPYVTDETLERIVMRDSSEQFDYRPEYDDGALVFDMTPGDMLHWPQNAPHRIVNGASMNVSLSAEFLSPGALVRANVIHANALLRRRLGLSPRIQGGFTPAALAKFAFARAAKAAGLRAAPQDPLKPSFTLDSDAEDGLRPLAA